MLLGENSEGMRSGPHSNPGKRDPGKEMTGRYHALRQPCVGVCKGQSPAHLDMREEGIRGPGRRLTAQDFR